MATKIVDVTSATNRNILLGILETGTSKSTVARAAGIKLSTFNRKIKGQARGFTLDEIGDIAVALDKELADILPVQLIMARAA